MPEINVNGTRLYYEMDGTGPPLLLLHGLGSSLRDWELQRPAWAAHYRLLLVDVRGHGRSAKPPGPYSVPLFTADVAALLRSLAWPPAHVVGISMGGMIGLQLALDEPALVRSLVVINATAALVARSWSDWLKVGQRLLIVRLLGMRRMGVFLAKRLFPHLQQEALRQVFVERWAQNDRRAYYNALRGLVGWSVRARLAQVGCPTLFLAAEFDYSPLAEKEADAARIPQGQLQCIPGSRHASTADRPEVVNTAVLDFLAAQP